MPQPVNYIATWFYKESEEEASFYPQLGGKGSSPLVHSIYMQIQVSFFVTFKHYNRDARLLFFTNLKKDTLPTFLSDLFTRLDVEIITLPYTCRPPKGWHTAWQNQFYLYDILQEAGRRMNADDVLLVSDADCLCRAPLTDLFKQVRTDGSGLYEFITERQYSINGITLEEMDAFYRACYGQEPQTPITYYGGEFIALRGDAVIRINAAYPDLWKFNLEYAGTHTAKLNEEAHVLSILAEALQLRNRTANGFVKRLWTSPQFNNVQPGDEHYAVWHLPYEKKRGLYRIYRQLLREGDIKDEARFWKKAGMDTGVPHITWRKKAADFLTGIALKLK